MYNKNDFYILIDLMLGDVCIRMIGMSVVYKISVLRFRINGLPGVLTVFLFNVCPFPHSYNFYSLLFKALNYVIINTTEQKRSMNKVYKEKRCQESRRV